MTQNNENNSNIENIQTEDATENTEQINIESSNDLPEEEKDTKDYAIIINNIVDSIKKGYQISDDQIGNIVLLSLIDLVKVNEGYDVIYNDDKITYEKGDRYHEINQRKVDQEIIIINNEFDEKIDSFLSKYPKNERAAFTEKKGEAEKVLLGGSSIYIEGKAEVLGITAEQFAQIIIDKNNEWAKLYTDLENEKDLKIASLKANLQ